MKSFNTLKVELSDPGILLVTLNRPEKINAINEEMLTELLQLIDEIEAGYPEMYRVVILRGAGRGFCSGADLKTFQDILENEKNIALMLLAKYHWFAQRWYDLPLPTIACLHGIVAGGGPTVSLLCDLRLATPDTSIRFSFSNIGLLPDLGSSYLIPAILGKTKALELMYLGNPITAGEALAIGLLNYVLPKEEMEQRALTMAKQLANGPTEAYEKIKRLVQNNANMSFSHTLAQEVICQAEMFNSPKFKQSVSNFFK